METSCAEDVRLLADEEEQPCGLGRWHHRKGGVDAAGCDEVRSEVLYFTT